MRIIEFKSKIRNQSIYIPKKFQAELKAAVGKDVRVIIFQDKDLNSIDSTIDFTKDELESINRGLKDFEEGRTHSNETVRKLYGKYL